MSGNFLSIPMVETPFNNYNHEDNEIPNPLMTLKWNYSVRDFIAKRLQFFLCRPPCLAIASTLDSSATAEDGLATAGHRHRKKWILCALCASSDLSGRSSQSEAWSGRWTIKKDNWPMTTNNWRQLSWHKKIGLVVLSNSQALEAITFL